MTLDEIKSRVSELDADPGWYQNIDLKNGLNTKTRRLWGEEIDHPRARWEAVAPAFPQSFAGKSVLDVGCNAGFFSFVAADRGASSVYGLDNNSKYIEQAKFANTVRGDNIRFQEGSATHLTSLKKTFDITLCIGLLYHVSDIYKAIKDISRVTTEMAIIESAIYNDDDLKPLMRVASGDVALPGIWHPNISALKALFEIAGFSRTETLFKDGARGGIVAYK
ncbi:MAG: methyltransferase domain-containing protein [Pseudomonadota bacterium]